MLTIPSFFLLTRDVYKRQFLSQNRDCFAIYQVSRDDPQNVRFMTLDWLKSHDISIDRSNYDLIYTAPLRESGTVYGNVMGL